MPRQLHFSDERRDSRTIEQRLSSQRHPIVLILDGLDNPSNAGSIFRLADAALVRHVYLYEMEDVVNKNKFLKAARATQRYVPWSYLHAPAEVEALKSTYQLVGLEVTDSSIPFHDYYPPAPVALVIGNENRGVRQDLLDLTQTCIHLPMYGINTSLNVAMAAGIAVYELLGKMAARG